MKFNISLHIFNEEPSFGFGVIHLLKKVDEYQSLSKAYKSMHMSSSKAWKIINKAEHDLGFQLIDSQSGGNKGGFSSLTQNAKKLVEQYEMFYNDINKFASERFEHYFKEL